MGVLLGNILITSPSAEEHLDNIEKVLRHLAPKLVYDSRQ